MHMKKRTLSAILTLVVTASLAVVPALLQSTSASPAPTVPARTAVTDECANAQTSLALAKASQAAAHRKLVRARKALRAAKRTHHVVAVRKAKRHLRAAKARYVVRTHNTRVQAARVGYACAAPSSSARAAGTGMKLNILAVATGAGGKLLDPAQLQTLLVDLLGSTTAGMLSQAQLDALLAGFNAGTPSLDDATVLLGSVFSPAQLTSLLGGSPDPTLVLTLTQNLIDELTAMAGAPAAAPLDATTLQGIVSTVTGLLGTVVTTVTGTTTGTTTGGGTGGTGGTLLCVTLLGITTCI
jgi:hypothetical protein